MRRVTVESPKGRVTYDDARQAVCDTAEWIMREAAAGNDAPCAGFTVSVHSDGEACDHES